VAPQGQVYSVRDAQCSATLLAYPMAEPLAQSGSKNVKRRTSSVDRSGAKCKTGERLPGSLCLLNGGYRMPMLRCGKAG
jgi:hypothetical protein